MKCKFCGRAPRLQGSKGQKTRSSWRHPAEFPDGSPPTFERFLMKTRTRGEPFSPALARPILWCLL